MELVAVVIPIYKNQLSKDELISLQQCVKILHQYPIILATPVSLDVSIILSSFTNVRCQKFDDYFFEGIDGYNKLMLSAIFYEKFILYNYILIYQLDCFVFTDELTFWCNQGYDYIGAPWLFKDRGLVHEIKKKIALWCNLKYKDGSKSDIIRKNEVGNGGFSLRNVQTFLNIIPKFKKEIEIYNQISKDSMNEDVFWGVEVNRYRRHLKVPNWQTAIRFSMESNLEFSFELTKGHLPFGCHAWKRLNPNFWKPHIEKFGYKIS